MTTRQLRGYPGDVFEPVLTRLGRDAVAFGGANSRLVPVAYHARPFSHVLRLKVQPDGGRPEFHVFVKIFKGKPAESGIDLHARVAQDFAITRSIHEFMSRWNDLGVVRPLACYDDLLAIVTEEAAGRTLLQYIESHGRWFPSDVRLRELSTTAESVGRWLRAFQGFEPRDGRVSLDDLRDYVDLRLMRLVTSGASLDEGDRQRILEHLHRLASQISQADCREVAIHADLAPGNILISDERVVVLDFAMAKRGSVLHDISRLYLQFDLLRAKPQFGTTLVATLQAGLLRGFDPSLSPAHPLFRLLSMLHRVNHLGTLSLAKERFPSNVLSRRVRGLHRRWIESELASATHQMERP